MAPRPSCLPDFGEPPVVEVVFAVRYSTADRLRMYHVGLYRELVKESFPDFQEQAPLPAGDEPAFQFMSGPPPLARCWFLDKAGNRLIQLQPDRFMHNWRKVTGQEEYPRYESIREEFAHRWDEFASFAEGQGLGAPTVKECALTYVNHIPKGTSWAEPGDVAHLLTPLSGIPALSCSEGLDAVSCDLWFRLAEGRGRLHAKAGPAVRTQDQTDIIRFDLTASSSASVGSGEMLEWFDFARECIVTGFAELTSDEAHRCWKRRM